jgi:DNA (cytosine-5)-methyltransferase 3A
MNVLSLFDGISCGRVALERAGIKVDNYFASEVDKYAITISKKNYTDIVQLGDVTKIDFNQLPKIDLLIAGSPCQGFSLAGKQLAFNDPRSMLFFKFVEALKILKPKYFLLENVRMKKEYIDVISEQLGVEPVMINSSLVSAQNRVRLYWANFQITQPQDKGILLKDVIQSDFGFDNLPYNESYISSKTIPINKDKFRTLRANAGGRTSGIGVCSADATWRKLTPIECERLQTLPDDYTEGVSNTQRYKALGNGWTVDVIAHILKGIKNV